MTAEKNGNPEPSQIHLSQQITNDIDDGSCHKVSLEEGEWAQRSSDHLHRALSARQVQMIAIGGTIGTGLFLGSGKSLATGGPASLLICYAIMGVIVFFTMLALGEMAAFIPVAGSFCTFARYVRMALNCCATVG